MTIETFIKNRINKVFKNSIFFSRNSNEIRNTLSTKDNDGLEIIPIDKFELERIDNLHDRVTFSYDDYAFNGVITWKKFSLIKENDSRVVFVEIA